ncbi:MAG TPA: site-2 protease family protein [Candidatus Limnocylindrales bacterium]
MGRIFGTDIRAHWSWIMVLAFVAVVFGMDLSDGTAASWSVALAWSASIATAVLVFTSVTAHELGHVKVARQNGQSVPTAVVQLLGGPYVMEVRPKTAGEEFRIAIAGSVVSIAVAIPFAIIGLILWFGPFDNAPDGIQAIGFVTAMIAGFNVFLAVLNLIPGYPLDGARVLHALVWMRTRDESVAMAVSIRVARYVGLALMGAGAVTMAISDPLAGLCLLVAGWLVVSSSRLLDRRSVVQDLVAGLYVRDAEDENPASVPPQLTLDVFASEYLADRLGAAALVRRGSELLGLIGTAQIRRIPKAKWMETRTEQAMALISSVPTVSPDLDLWSALEVLERTGLDALLVSVAGDGTTLLSRRSAAKLVHDRAEVRHKQMELLPRKKGWFRGK